MADRHGTAGDRVRVDDADPSRAAISARGVVRRFGDRAALAGVSLDVRAGEVHALLGPNGAGKTTLIRVLSGLVDPTEGDISTTGAVGLVPCGDRTFYLRISGLENLIFFARLHGLRLRAARRRAREVLDQVGLREAAKVPVGRYSHGMQKRLSVGRALLVDPAVLLVDEATHDLDPEGARLIRNLVRALAERGTAVLWTTQRIEEIRDFADRVTFLGDGTVRFSGSVGELIELGPRQRYVVKLRNGHPGPPQALAVQRALGALAEVRPGPGGLDHFVLAPYPDQPLGATFAALAGAGFDLLACRHERAEIEEAFLALTSEDAR